MEIDDRKKTTRIRELGARLKRGFRLFFLRLLRLKGQPEEVAGGIAIGVFIGLTPTVPLHTILSVLIAFLLGKSKLAAALGGWIANPFLLPFIYILDYKVGRTITGIERVPLVLSDPSISHLLQLGSNITYPLFVGGLTMGLLSIFPSYYITKRLVILYRERRRKRLEKIGLPSPTT